MRTWQRLVAILSVLMAWLMTGATAAIHWQVVRFAWGDWHLLLGVLICAVFATAVAFTVQLWAQQHTTASHAAILLRWNRCLR